MAQAKKKIEAVNAEPVVRISDYHHMLGGLFNAAGYPTFYGRCVMQPIQNAAFSAFAYKDENEETPAISSAAAMEQAMTCTPYKEGIDASLVTFERPDIAGKRPRVGLVADLLMRTSDLDPEKIAELAKAVKAQAVETQIMSLTKKNMGGGIGGSKGVARRVAAGFNRLEEMDESWDETFLTKAVEFLVEYQREDYLRTEEDKANYAYMKAVLAGVQTDEQEAPIVFNI